LADRRHDRRLADRTATEGDGSTTRRIRAVRRSWRAVLLPRPAPGVEPPDEVEEPRIAASPERLAGRDAPAARGTMDQDRLVAELPELAPEEANLAKLSLGDAEAAREPPGHDDKPQRDGADQEDHPRRPPVRGRRSAVKRARGSR